MVTSNYNFRTRDLYMLGLDEIKFGKPGEEIQFTLQSEAGGKLCAGVLKTVQKVIIQLLTYRYYFDPNWGTQLSELISMQNMPSAQAYVENTFAIAAGQTIELLNSQLLPSTPLDEAVRTILLRNVSIDRDKGTIRITAEIVFMSGLRTEITLPIAKDV